MTIPTGGLLDRLQILLATDTLSLAPATLGCKVHLAMAPFTPGPLLTLADFVEATFVGYTPLLAGPGGQEFFFDPITSTRVTQLNEPALGWHWKATVATGLPQTIFGFYVTDNADAELWGSLLLAPPVRLTSVGDGVDLPWVRFGLVAGALV